MVFTDDMDIIELDSFDTAFPVAPEGEADAKRRFMTLFAPASNEERVGGTSVVRKVRSFTGDTFALKRLIAADTQRSGVQPGTPEYARLTAGRAAGFYEEYKNQLLVSHLRGFPRLYGYGRIGDDPVIIMEWVEGVSLREYAVGAARRHGRVPTNAIIALGLQVSRILEDAARLDVTLSHRDISPSNIIIRTSQATPEEQEERNAFDLCLVDFGTSAVMDPLENPSDPSFTMTTQAWRYGTPEYAAPEMLTRDLPAIDDLRKSQTIDTFALCSVLYELYTGHTPWRVADHMDVSPYLLKTQQAPESLTPRDAGDTPLVELILEGLSVEQEKRPGVPELARRMQRIARDRQLIVGEDETRTDPLSLRDTATEGVHLEMATSDRGGRRAGEDAVSVVPAVPAPRKVSRRSFVIGGLVLAAGAIVGGSLAWHAGAPEPDFSGYPLVDSPSKRVLYPARHLGNRTWVLRDAASSFEAVIGSASREPGRPSGGLYRAYDAVAKRYGFLGVDESGASPEAGWRVLPRFADAGDFPDDDDAFLAAAKAAAGGTWGYIDADGKLVIKEQFRRAAPFSHGYAAVQPQGQYHWGLIDATGAMTLDARFNTLGQCSEEGLMAARENGAAFGFVNLSGEWALPPAYAQVRRFTEGLAACTAPADNGLWGYIGPDGSTRIEPQFADAYPFSQGLAPAQDARTKLWGLIGMDGSWQVKPQFLAIGERLGDLFPAHGSPAGVYDIDGADEKAWSAYLEEATDEVFGYGYIDERGTWAIAPTYGDTLIRTPRK